MNFRPHPFPRFAVNRADALSRLPGVHLPAGAKCFARGHPRLQRPPDPALVEDTIVAEIETTLTFPPKSRFRRFL
jgi:hypothetical protein